MSSSEDSEVNLCCPICLEKYNTNDRIPIVARRCAHTICQPCAIKRNSPVCVVCNVTSLYSDGGDFPSSFWFKNFALIECIQEMDKMKAAAEQEKLKMEQNFADLKSQYENDIDHMSCGYCQLKERRERMKICCSCAGIKDMDSTGKDMEAELLSVTICAFCYTERHLSHNVINYLTFKVHNSLSLTSSDGIEMVNSMNEMCVQEAKNGAEQIVAWKEKMNCFRKQNRADVTYRDCLSINESLKKEAEIVCSASEDTLPSLRMLTKVVKESHDRVSTLLSGIAKREGDGIFGYFTKNAGFVKDDGICLYEPKSNIVVCVGRVPDIEAIARDNRNRKVHGLAEYLNLEPLGKNKRTRLVHHRLTKKGFAIEVNGKLQTRSGREAVTIWKVVYGGERQGEEEREQTEQSEEGEETKEQESAGTVSSIR